MLLIVVTSNVLLSDACSWSDRSGNTLSQCIAETLPGNIGRWKLVALLRERPPRVLTYARYFYNHSPTQTRGEGTRAHLLVRVKKTGPADSIRDKKKKKKKKLRSSRIKNASLHALSCINCQCCTFSDGKRKNNNGIYAILSEGNHNNKYQ